MKRSSCLPHCNFMGSVMGSTLWLPLSLVADACAARWLNQQQTFSQSRLQCIGTPCLFVQPEGTLKVRAYGLQFNPVMCRKPTVDDVI